MNKRKEPIGLPPVTLEELARRAEERSEVPSFPKSLPNEVNEGKQIPEAHAKFTLQLITAYARTLGDALNLYLPLPNAEPFHSSRKNIRLVSGSNQSGKTAAASFEFARMMRGMDPYEKYPEKDVLALVLGKDENHIGQTIWSKLYFPGAFQIVRDENDGFWRAVRPDPNDPVHIDPIDLVRKSEWKPAPPLLTEAWTAQLAYAKKNKDIPAQIVGTNGSKALFHTSRGSARQGIQLDYAWLDEEVINERWVHELIGPRLVKKNGCAVWSATPEDQTPQFFELLKRANANDPHVELFMLQVADNPYYSDESKEKLYANLKAQGEAVLQVKWYGRPAIAGLAVYPQYSQQKQGIVPFEIPENWMRVAAIDPGTQFAAAVFFAINPEATEIHVYDELLVRNEDARTFAQQFRQKVDGYQFDAYIIDKNGSRQKSMGRADTTFDHYAKCFEEVGVPPSRLTGTKFFFGNNDHTARTISLNSRLTDGTLKFHIGRTYLLDGQIPKRYYAKDNPNKRAKQKEIDLVDCLEYGVAYFDKGIYYHEPERPRDISTEYEDRMFDHFKNKGKNKHRPQWSF